MRTLVYQNTNPSYVVTTSMSPSQQLSKMLYSSHVLLTATTMIVITAYSEFSQHQFGRQPKTTENSSPQ